MPPIESGMITESSAQEVMEARMYNRIIEFHELVYGTLLHLVWYSCLQTKQKHHLPTQLLDRLNSINEGTSDTSATASLGVVASKQVLQPFDTSYLAQMW